MLKVLLFNLKIYLLCLIVEITEVVEVVEPVEVVVTEFLVVEFVCSMDLESLNLIGLKCPSPRKIKLSALDKDGEYREIQERYVPCGKCYVCLSSRRMQWQFRLEVELLRWKNCQFVTLTFDDDHLPDTVSKRDLQLLFKRLRFLGHKFRYYAIGEYGTRLHRPHYHVIFFSDDNLQPDIDHVWNVNGFTYYGTVTSSSIGYVLHYHIRPKVVNGKFTFALMSKGLGVDFLDLRMQKFIEFKDDFVIRNRFGSKSILPRYYRKKFFSDKEVVFDHDKFEIPSGLEHSAEYLFSLREAYKAKLNKFNNQDKL